MQHVDKARAAGRKRRRHVEVLLVLDVDFAAHRAEESTDLRLRGIVDFGRRRPDAHALADGRGRVRHHADDGGVRQRARDLVDRHAGHDRDDRLVAAELALQPVRGCVELLRLHREDHDLGAADDGDLVGDGVDAVPRR